MKYYTMPETRGFLESIGMPGGDLYDLPTSAKRFPDGGQYRFEVPGIQGPGPMKALLEALDEYGVQIHRVTQTKGIMFLTDDEIKQMVEYAKKWNVQLVLACGPRATTDTSASVKTEEGQRMGYRLRGEEQIARGIEEIRRGARLGVRGFLVYDEGLLWALGEAIVSTPCATFRCRCWPPCVPLLMCRLTCTPRTRNQAVVSSVTMRCPTSSV